MGASIYLNRDNKLRLYAWTNRGQMVSSSSNTTAAFFIQRFTELDFMIYDVLKKQSQSNCAHDVAILPSTSHRETKKKKSSKSI